MVQDVIQHNVFNFVALRAADSVSKDKLTRRFVRDGRDANNTVLDGVIHQDPPPDHAGVLAWAREQAEEHKVTAGGPPEEAFETLEKARQHIAAAKDGHQDELIQELEAKLGMSISDFLDANRDLEDKLWDWLYLGYILNTAERFNLENLINALRTLHFLRLLLNDPKLVDEQFEREQVLRATPILPKELGQLVQGSTPRNPTSPPTVEPSEAEVSAFKKMVNEYAALNETASTLPTLPLESRMNTTTRVIKTTTIDGEPVTRNLQITTASMRIKPDAFNSLSDETKVTLRRFGSTMDEPNLAHAATAMSTRQATLSNQIMNITSSNPTLAKAARLELANVPDLNVIIGAFETDENRVPPVNVDIRKLIRPLGIGDLLVVKQKLKKYLAGEVAHIENVMKGESKQRDFRTLDRTETILVTTQETVEETEKDTQTTERFELKKESEKTIQENMSLQAGVTITASYGPVSLGASADFAYSTSSQDTQRTASNFARDVVERSVSKIQKRAKEERTTKNLHEVEEINKHGIDAVTAAGHIVGVYRWVDKLYDAQIYNYGKRLMFEFILPEPAAFYIYAQNNNPKKSINVPKPPDLPDKFSADSIKPDTYRAFAAMYEVQGLNPPPQPYKSMTIALDQSGIENGKTISKTVKDLVCPDGYHVVQVEYSVSLLYQKYPEFDLTIGDWIYPIIHDKRALTAHVTTTPGHVSESSIVAVAINGYDINAYTVNVAILCALNPEGYQLWQNQVYEKIVAARQVKMAEYEQKLKAADAARGVVIQGRNPAANRQIEKTELKKLAVTMMTGQYYTRFNSMWELPNAFPEMFLSDAIDEGKFIQFFEQAFEWTQMTYLFYPYFWGKRANWVRNSNLPDNDPLFARFLEAGAARVVVPVHPAYNDAVMFYLETGKLWNGGDSPRLEDDLFISIAEELRNQTDDLANAIPVGDAWEVNLPTQLVWLQPGPELPDFTV